MVCKGKQCSWHYHNKKDEVFYVQSGKLMVYYSNFDDFEMAYVKELNAGEKFHVPTGMRHRMRALEDTVMFEFSTEHFDEDSVRIEKRLWQLVITDLVQMVGLGNQMFQYAGLRGIAKQHGYSWLIPPPDDYGDSNYGLFDCFEMSTVTLQNFGYLSTDQNIATGCFHFNEQFFRGCPDNVNLHDYFQTEKYFKNAEKIIREDYRFQKKF